MSFLLSKRIIVMLEDGVGEFSLEREKSAADNDGDQMQDFGQCFFPFLLL
jgi:hypothetical protein